MWLQRFTDYLLRHRWQSVLLTFAITFVPLIGVIGIVIAALVTLMKGVVEGAVFTVAATLPFGISLYLSSSHGDSTQLAFFALIGAAMISNILTWVFAIMLRRKASWSQIIQIAALLGVLAISVAHLAYPEIADWWGLQLHAYTEQAMKSAGMLSAQASMNEDQLDRINLAKQAMTGWVVVSILFNAILQLVVARWWQVGVYGGSLRKELRGIRLSRLAAILFLASLVFSYLGNSVVLDIMPVLYMLFGAAGLSLVHYLAGLANPSTAWLWLSVFYVTLLISLVTVVVSASSVLIILALLSGLVLLALLDAWLNVRKRIQKV